MRKKAVLLFALALGLAAVAAGASSAGPAARKATLKITDVTPVTVRGSGFRSRERVKVVAVASTRQVHLTRAGAGGTFTAVFPDVEMDRCSGPLVVTAQGRAGSFARTKVLQELDCPPGLGP